MKGKEFILYSIIIVFILVGLIFTINIQNIKGFNGEIESKDFDRNSGFDENSNSRNKDENLKETPESSNNEEIIKIASSNFCKLLPDVPYYPFGFNTIDINFKCKRVVFSLKILNNSEERPLKKDEENKIYIYILLSDFSIPLTYCDFKNSPTPGKLSIEIENNTICDHWAIYFINKLENLEINISYEIMMVVEKNI